MGKRFLVLLQVAILLKLAPALALADAFSEKYLCGPRAVLDVLESYQQKAALADLLKDASQDRPWSLQDVADSLSTHGVFAHCVAVNDPQQLQWNGPVILHLVPSKAENSGHFVVFFPNAPNPKTPILDCTQWRPWSAVAPRLSGRAVLTAQSRREYLTDVGAGYLSIFMAASGLACLAAFLTRHLFLTSPDKSSRWLRTLVGSFQKEET
jgi:hypothetical protein